MSPGAVTDGVTLFYLKSDMTVIVIVTTPNLSASPGDRLSSVPVNSAAKNI